MGDGAQMALEYAARNMWDRSRPRKPGRNPIAARCPICHKGIRSIAGEVRESLAMHMKAKHGQFKEPQGNPPGVRDQSGREVGDLNCKEAKE